jgi:hypothetical protein
MADGYIRQIAGTQTRIENPHEAAFNIAGDAEWRFDIAPSTWLLASGTSGHIINRYNAGATKRVWLIQLFDSAPQRIRMQTGNADGTFRAAYNLFFNTSGPFADGQRVQCRIRLTANNGSNQTVFTLHTRTGANIQSLASDNDWVLEDTVTTAGAQAWMSTDQHVTLMRDIAAGSGALRGKFYGMKWWGSLNKTNPILDIDFTTTSAALNAPKYTSWDDAVSADNWTAYGVSGSDWNYVPPINPAGSTITYIAHVAATTGATSQTELVINMPPDTVPGHVMVATVRTRGSVTVTGAPSGWTAINPGGTGDTTNGHVYLYWKTAGESEPASYTWTFSTSSRMVGGITTFSGVDTEFPIHAHDAVLTAATSVTAPSVTTTVPGCMLIRSYSAMTGTSAENLELYFVTAAGATQLFSVVSPTTQQNTVAAFAIEPYAGPGASPTRSATLYNSLDQPYSRTIAGYTVALAPAGGGAPPANLLTDGMWKGGVTATSFRVAGKMKAASSDVRIRASTTTDFASSVLSSPFSTDANLWFKAEITGLQPNTLYYWRLEDGAAVDESPLASVYTPPTPSAPATFTFAVGNCAAVSEGVNGVMSNHEVFERIQQWSPRFFAHLDDLHYRDYTVNNPALYRQAFEDILATSRQGALYRNVPLVYVRGDHDYYNDGDKNSVIREAANLAYRQCVPHYNLDAGNTGDGNYGHSFVYGRVRFIVCDVRSDREPNTDPDTASKTMLGAVQKQRLKDYCLQAKADGHAIVILWSTMFHSTGDADLYSGYTTERRELADFFSANDLWPRMAIFGGELHSSAIASPAQVGSHATVPTTGCVQIHAGALDRNSSSKGGAGTFALPRYPDPGVRIHQYGRVTITDTGSASITLQYDGREVVQSGDNWVDQAIVWPAETSDPSLTNLKTVTMEVGASALPQPVIASVTPLSTSALRVAFSTHAEYSDYQIERGGVTVASGVTASPWDDSGLTANTQYSYRVRGRVA